MKLIESQERSYKKEVYNLVDDINLTVVQIGKVVTQVINNPFEEGTSFYYVEDREKFLEECKNNMIVHLLDIASSIQDYKKYFNSNGFNPENLFNFCYGDESVRNYKNEKVDHLFKILIFKSSLQNILELSNISWDKLKKELSNNKNISKLDVCAQDNNLKWCVENTDNPNDEIISFYYVSKVRLDVVDIFKHIDINLFDLLNYEISV